MSPIERSDTNLCEGNTPGISPENRGGRDDLIWINP